MTNKIATTTEIVDNYCGHKGEQLVKEFGASYVPGRDIKDIAKDVRAIIRKAIKSGYLPAMKVSVKIERSSMCSSLDVTVTDINETVINVDAWRQQAAQNFNLSWIDCGGRLNSRGQDIMGFLELVVKSFQRSEMHGQSDYCNVNFYEHIKFDSDILKSQFAELAECE